MSHITISGLIATHCESAYWGRITINAFSGLIEKIERGKGLIAVHTFGEDCLIFAGFGDVHIHAREDNTGKQNYKEDYATATAAALNGGVVHVMAMPNTVDPVIGGQQLGWHRNHVRSGNYVVAVLNYIGIDKTTRPLGKRGEYPYKKYFAKSVGPLTVMFAGEVDTIMQWYRGEYVSSHLEYEPIVLMSSEGKTHSDRRPVECVNEALRLYLPLIEKHGIKAKLCHWSTGGESFELIEEYRARGCHIELEVSPLHLLNDTSMTEKDPSLWLQLQMNPAIQGPGHRHDLITGLREGFIQYLATDHAPHTEEEKHSAFAEHRHLYPGMTNEQIAANLRVHDRALFDETCVKNNHSGAPWLDTYALVCCWLMHEHRFATQDIARVAAYNPGQFANRFLPAQYPGHNFGKGFGDIAEGYMGSLTVLNTAKTTVVDRKNLKTKVGWSPLEGREMPGALEAVFIEGELQ